MMRKLIGIFLLLSITVNSIGQELNCNVQISTQQVQSDKTVFDRMQTSVYEFMNNTKWTQDEFDNEERIECSILTNITEQVGSDEFKANIQVQSRRPTYMSSYFTNLLNHNDNDIYFKYTQFDQLTYSENTYQSELTSLLAFYAYMVLGYDYDSFALYGGSPYFQKAIAIVNAAQSSQSPGWKAFEGSKNRYWLVNNHIDQVFKPLRECFYKYHRTGMDIFYEKPQEAREVIYESVSLLTDVHSTRPNSYNMQVFFSAKHDELVKMFSPAPEDQKAKVVQVLKRVDPGHTANYQKILSSR